MTKKEKSTKDKENKPVKKSILKYFLYGFAILILILIFLGYLFLRTPSEKIEFVIIDKINGNVEINQDNTWILAKEGVILEKTDKIRTNSGNITLNINNGIFLYLEPNSEVEIQEILKENINIKLNKGSSWTKFVNVLGIETYEVETPNAVAIVRGTEFKVTFKNNSTELITTEGKVNFTDENNNSILVGKYEKYSVDSKGLKKEELTIEDKKEILKNKKIILENLKKARLEEINKNEFILEQVKKQYNIDDKKINELLNAVDNGEIDEKPYLDKLPFKIRNIDKITKLTEQIKEMVIDTKELETEINNN